MEGLGWLVAATVLFVAVHIVIAVYLYRKGNRKAEATAAPTDSADEPPDQVTCPTCGTPNAPGFRYCRRCVSDLSGGGTPDNKRPAAEQPGS